MVMIGTCYKQLENMVCKLILLATLQIKKLGQRVLNKIKKQNVNYELTNLYGQIYIYRVCSLLYY
jgi:hypothetical protein